MKKLYVFGADWCSGCKQMKTMLKQNNVPFEEVDIDTDQGGDLAMQYAVRSLPTLVAVDDEGWIATWVGSNTPIKKIKDVMDD